MNKRIKLLAEQAGFKVNWQHEDVQAIKMARFEKFAELIVKECMELASKEQKRYASITHRNMSECAAHCAVALGNFSLLIKDHFEDEE